MQFGPRVGVGVLIRLQGTNKILVGKRWVGHVMWTCTSSCCCLSVISYRPTISQPTNKISMHRKGSIGAGTWAVPGV